MCRGLARCQARRARSPSIGDADETAAYSTVVMMSDDCEETLWTLFMHIATNVADLPVKSG